MSDYYCPNCGADLGDQGGFDPDASQWKCTECGQLLLDPDSDDSGRHYEGVRWYCDACGARLDDQFGFSDWCDTWECTECGHVNSINSDEIYHSESEYRSSHNIDEDEDDEDEGNENDEDDDNEERNISNSQFSSSNRNSDTKHFWIHLILVSLFIAIVLACLDDSSDFSTKSATIDLDDKLGFSSESIVGMNHEDAVKKITSAGFKSYNIKEIPIDDIDFHNKELIGTVSEITIDGLNRFSENNVISKNSDVEIEYHTYMDVTIPYSPSELKKMTYNEALVDLMNAGFINVESNPLGDLKISNKKDGRITEVTIDGEKKFKKDTNFKADVEIIISYHSVMETDTGE